MDLFEMFCDYENRPQCNPRQAAAGVSRWVLHQAPQFTNSQSGWIVA
jgi:hypothetical protein